MIRSYHIYRRTPRGGGRRVVQIRRGRVYGRGEVLAEGTEAGHGNVVPFLRRQVYLLEATEHGDSNPYRGQKLPALEE